MLRQIQQPLRITVFLSAEDPRLTDFEQNVLRKLRRKLPHLEVVYAASSRTGLFAGAEDHYGEIWYEMNGQRMTDRSTIEEVVLEQIYQLAGVKPPAHREESISRLSPGGSAEVGGVDLLWLLAVADDLSVVVDSQMKWS